jgi:pSer/pThr/pTyr-binding forkhead associated (FHA) protein
MQLMSNLKPIALAKVTWEHPQTGSKQEFILMEGASITIGRSAGNDIHIPEQHVSRQHTSITYRDGVFLINDMESANGTFVNDQPVTEPYPLISGDVIRLYVPILHFSAILPGDTTQSLEDTGTMIVAAGPGTARLIITTGPQEGEVIALQLEEVTVGRATTNYTWEIGLQDPSVSRPHARLVRTNGVWHVHDMGSANGTMVNKIAVNEAGHPLTDGDVVAFGGTLVLFRTN